MFDLLIFALELDIKKVSWVRNIETVELESSQE